MNSPRDREVFRARDTGTRTLWLHLLTGLRNLQLLCRSCHATRSAHTMEEWTWAR